MKEDKFDKYIRDNIEEEMSSDLFDQELVVEEPKLKWRRRKLYWNLKDRLAYDAVVMVVLLLVTYLVFHFVFGLAMVDGDSMDYTLQDKQIVFYTRIHGNYDKGDVVSVRMPSGSFYVKRVIGVEGDVIDVRDGQVYVNDTLIDEPYVVGQTLPEEGEVTYPVTVGENQYFIMGDNREHSNDSRAFGVIVKDRITGKVHFSMGKVK
ncbi:MAG: signal peptidase I [Lachnospiraceae bacterium]|nr:signal peptidase I [Lachnospiraceae bacterium]MDD3615319.1 signal peptidase I [Lachnospiraceae bacterium]